MQKRFVLLWLASASLVFSSLACNLGAAPTPAPVPATPARFELPTTGVQPATSAPPTSPPEIGETATPALPPSQPPALKQESEPTHPPPTEPPPTEVPPTVPPPTEAGPPTLTPTPVIDVALQSELFFSTGGFVYYGCDKLIPPEAAQGPVIMGLPRLEVSFMGGDLGGLCLFGFPLQGRLALDLTSPNGQTMSARYNIVDSRINIGFVQLDQLKPFQAEGLGIGGVKDGVSYIQVPLYWPAGLRTGKWQAHAKIGDTTADASFRIPRFSEPHISIVPEGDISPFTPAGCAVFNQGQNIRVRGASFPDGAVVPLGVYWKDPDSKGFKLLATHGIQAGDGGAFMVVFTIDASMPVGSYDLVAVTNPDSTQIYFAGAWACLTIK